MKLLLQADIPKLGDYGDLVEVSNGYARNCLLPQRLAVEPTEANMKVIALERARQAEQNAREQLSSTASRGKEDNGVPVEKIESKLKRALVRQKAAG